MSIYIDKWLDKAKIDYFQMFIQAWIPFNAWYMREFYDEGVGRKSDSDIMYYIGHNDNHYRARIVALLQNSDPDSVAFRQTIAKLQYELISHPMPSAECQLTLDTICISPQGGNISEVGQFGTYDIKCEYNRSLPRTSRRIKCEVINRRTSHTKYVIEQFEWNLTEFQNIREFVNIPNDNLKQKIVDVYKQVNPRKPTQITKSPIISGGLTRAPRNSISLHHDPPLYVTDNVNIVAEVIVHLMYELRCKLFHGELDPLEVYQQIYRYAYEIQMMLNKEIR